VSTLSPKRGLATRAPNLESSRSTRNRSSTHVLDFMGFGCRSLLRLLALVANYAVATHPPSASLTADPQGRRGRILGESGVKMGNLNQEAETASSALGAPDDLCCWL
jgi:hypothetical protein